MFCDKCIMSLRLAVCQIIKGRCELCLSFLACIRSNNYTIIEHCLVLWKSQLPVDCFEFIFILFAIYRGLHYDCKGDIEGIVRILTTHIYCPLTQHLAWKCFQFDITSTSVELDCLLINLILFAVKKVRFVSFNYVA